MRHGLLLLTLLVTGCWQSHATEAPPARGGTDAGLDGGADAGFEGGTDAAFDAGEVEVCTPPMEWLRDRSPEDSQWERDLDRALATVEDACVPEEPSGSVGVCFTVSPRGRVDVVDTLWAEHVDGTCLQSLRGLCLPTVIGMPCIEMHVGLPPEP